MVIRGTKFPRPQLASRKSSSLYKIMFDFRDLLRKKVMNYVLDFNSFSILCTKQVSLNKHDVFKLCEEKNCPFYVDAQSLVAIMESLVTPTREWLVPVHIARSQRLGETYDIYLKCFSLVYCMVGMI